MRITVTRLHDHDKAAANGMMRFQGTYVTQDGKVESRCPHWGMILPQFAQSVRILHQ